MLDLLKKPVAEVETLALSRIRRDGGTQMRAGLNQATVQEYADVLIDGGTLPAPVVFYDGAEHWLGDGFHRCEAYQRVHGALHRVEVHVRAGTRRDAILYAAGANADHGLRRTQADKERAVDTLLRDEEWAAWSDREIARRCNVSPTFVGGRRRLLNPEGADAGAGERTYQTKHGTVTTMKTANIGKVEKKQITLDQCIALVWRTIKHNTVSIKPSERIQWLKRARMQEFWNQLAADEAQPSDELILRAIQTVENELNGQFEHERNVLELTKRMGEASAKGHQEKYLRGGMTKREYAVKLVPEIAEWLRGYHDEHGRGWREIADVASHSNSICWRDITKAWGERGIYYSEDVLKAAIELAILSLQQQDDIVTANNTGEKVITETLDNAVRRALCVHIGDDKRWEDMAIKGASDNEIANLLRHMITSKSGSSGPNWYHVECSSSAKGPQIKVGRHIGDREPLLVASGKVLIRLTRVAWSIPLPSDHPVTVHVDSDEDTPQVACPQCGQHQADYDGFGVLRCEMCGYCAHPSLTGGVCEICGATVAPPAAAAGDDRCAQLRRLLELYQGTLDSVASYGKLTGHFSHEPPLRRALEPMLAELQSTLKALCSPEG